MILHQAKGVRFGRPQRRGNGEGQENNLPRIPVTRVDVSRGVHFTNAGGGSGMGGVDAWSKDCAKGDNTSMSAGRSTNFNGRGSKRKEDTVAMGLESTSLYRWIRRKKTMYRDDSKTFEGGSGPAEKIRRGTFAVEGDLEIPDPPCSLEAEPDSGGSRLLRKRLSSLNREFSYKVTGWDASNYFLKSERDRDRISYG